MSKSRSIFFASGVLIAVQAFVLFLFGQPAICECGTVKLWEGMVLSSGNSQHLTDWYTFSHIIHGFLFYWVLTIAAPRLSLGTRLLLALGAEVSWEVVENTPWLIEHYRQQALAQGYIGDSVINSISDTLAMVAGFFLARRLPVLTTVAIGVSLELFVGASIRDNLTLNVLGFFHQFEFIRIWQSGGQ
ncbi:hypothetical protein A3B35_01495 [Candidatus Kaiserbacteria bacterium RIFCSPLOWO2_01_FULL_54_24]|uniref:Uncharacterized protein n=1 Tax=Candidatus Kaiserbacteria bacterium RIFCSPLOWO2_01_FULL_54_24 TaxID=1798515 RepID=A0A1F6EVV2_9BACT|nr:MAG: hypothetical protein A3B35_01495 [Candidatus Kaiserbacteria bacterium RIFCSPLOWO2_01_FULL_54_24]